jgi:hypothetical protein
MKILVCALAFMVTTTLSHAQEITVQKVQGDVRVRHGVTEQWSTIAAGDVLKPDDSMLTGANGRAVILAMKKGVEKRITLPPEVIVDMADVRDLSPDELMLKLTMERVRSSPSTSPRDLTAPNAGVVHGGNERSGPALPENDPAAGSMHWNGARVLFNNGFYSTCALKGMELYRLYPETAKSFENRVLVAQSLERENLRGDALNEYAGILTLDGLTAAQQVTVKQEMQRLQEQ